MVLYGIRFGYTGYFARGGTALLLGKFNSEPFSCLAKSGGQNLWLPFKQDVGLKVFHPKGFSGTLEKAKIHFEDQALLAEKEICPKPLEMFEITLSFVKPVAIIPPWTCYGITMNRVLNGGVPQILKNLELFGVEHTEQIHRVIESWVNWYGSDALTLSDYMVLCRFFGGSLEQKRLKEIIDDMKSRMPAVFSNAPDLLSWPNVALNEKGEAKVIDCDLSRN